MSAVLDEAETRYLKSLVPVLAEECIHLDGKPLRLERPWQWDLVGSINPRDVWAKARQVGFSFGTSVRSLLRAHLFPPGSYNAVMVSINREEAREKIKYVEMLHDAMDKDKRRKLLTNNKLEMEFDNGNAIKSFPSRAVRGIPNVDLLLDEFAHIRDAKTIYTGSTASTIRQSYGVTIGSTPYGRGTFQDICKGAGRAGEYKHFSYHEIPWWTSEVLCRKPSYARAWAPEMSTVDRVAAFGVDALLQELEDHTLETFQTEFEVAFLDFINSVLNPQMIENCSDGSISCEILDLDFSIEELQAMELIKEKLKIALYEEKMTCGIGGFDVGREVHASELILGDFGANNKVKTRLYFTLRKCPFSIQKDIISYLMRNLPIQKMVIDAQGIGASIAEDLMGVFSTRIHPMTFGENTKTEMVNATLKAFDEKTVILYPTRRINSQLLDVRKVTSANGRILYRSATKKEEHELGPHKTHADLFWAMAMMLWGVYAHVKAPQIRVTRRSPSWPSFSMTSGWSGHPIKPRLGGFRRG